MEIKKSLLYPASLSFIFFCIYLFFSPPGIVFGDSPELILASYSLGITHPPGYPLYSLLTKAFHYIVPFLSYAKACNTFSAFISSISLFIFFKTLERANVSILICTLSTLTLAFSEVYFKQSQISEVYSLNNFFFVTLLFLITSYYFNPQKRKIFLAFFLIGLGLANHHTLLSFLVVGILFFFLLVKKNIKTFLIALLFLILGLTTYLYLPVRSMSNPVLDWGDPESIGNFLEVILRKQFGFGGGERSFEKFLNQLLSYGIFLWEQLFILIILSILGIYLLFRQEKKLLLPIFLIFLINGLLTPIVLNSTEEDFFLVKEFLTPSLIMAIFFVAYGAGNFNPKRWFVYLYLSLFIFSLGYKFYLDVDSLDKRKDIYSYRLAKDSLEFLPQGAFIIGESDYTLFPLWYLQYVEGVRKDVTVLDADFLMLPWYQRQNITRIPILKELIPDISSHASSRKGSFLDESVLEGFKLDQSELLARNIKEKLNKEVFFTYDFYEMSRFYKPQVLKNLYNYGVVYHLTFDKKFNYDYSKLDVSHLLGSINLNKEELIFLTPYIPTLIEKAQLHYKSFETTKAIEYLNNAFYIAPRPEIAIYLAYVLADEGKELKRSEILLRYAQRGTNVFLPRQNLILGLIALRQNRLNDAYTFLLQEEKINPDSCDAKIFLLELFLKKGERDKAELYFKEVESKCGDYYKERVSRIFKKP